MALGRILPIVMLGSLTAIVIAGLLNQLGKRYPHLTGEGSLMPSKQGDSDMNAVEKSAARWTSAPSPAALLAILLYMVGMLLHRLIGLPAPVGMLFAAVAVKLAHGVSPRIQEGSQVVYKFFRTAVTYPILFAVGVAITPWQELVDAFTVQNLIVIVTTVSALVATGFFVGKKIGMHPIDVAIVSCCQSGQGGTGDVAILTAGNRMSLMPFAQIATRIGALSTSRCRCWCWPSSSYNSYKSLALLCLSRPAGFLPARRPYARAGIIPVTLPVSWRRRTRRNSALRRGGRIRSARVSSPR